MDRKVDYDEMESWKKKLKSQHQDLHSLINKFHQWDVVLIITALQSCE